MELYQVIGLALVSATLAILLRQYRPEYGLMLSLICSIVILTMIIAAAKEAMDSIAMLLERANISEEFSGVLFKALGICVVTQLAGDTCRDAGEGAIASKVEMAGKLAVLLVSLPLFLKLLEISATLMAI